MFLADKQESDKIFSALGGDAAAQTLDRSDVYVAVGDSLGLKLRGGRDGLECKLRLARKKRGAWCEKTQGCRSILRLAGADSHRACCCVPANCSVEAPLVLP
jgi:hypothetical protein